MIKMPLNACNLIIQMETGKFQEFTGHLAYSNGELKVQDSV